MHTLPPAQLFWPLLALCAVVFAVLFAVVRDAGRGARLRVLRQRIAAIGPPSHPADGPAVEQLQAAMARAQQALRQAPPPRRSSTPGRHRDDEENRRDPSPAPWLLFLGDAQADLPGLLSASPLEADPSGEPPAQLVRQGWRWWTGGSMAAIEIDPRVFEDAAAAPMARGLWLASLFALAERRERLPLHGIVACIGAPALRDAQADPDAFRARVLRLRRLADEAARSLRLQLPLHLVVTGLERLEGHAALRGALPPEVLAQALGHRVQPGHSAGDAATPTERMDAAFEPVLARLHALRMGLLCAPSDASGRLAVHSFVESVRSLQPGLRLAAEGLLEGRGRKARESRALRWRGLYLCAAAAAQGGSGAFSGDLFERFLLADRSLARPGRPPAEGGDAGAP